MDEIPGLLTADVTYFPPPELALTEPDGLLAMGGDLSVPRLLQAYRLGIFPWYAELPILWWCPGARTVLFLDDFIVAKSLRKKLRQGRFEIKVDENFVGVINACAQPRLSEGKMETQTWLTPEMISAYTQLHDLGYAHSVEVYVENQLIGGIYGVSLGLNFFGESMFSRLSDGSKIALFYLVEILKKWHFKWLDCQMASPHLSSLGATALTRPQFLKEVAANNKFETKIGKWQLPVG